MKHTLLITFIVFTNLLWGQSISKKIEIADSLFNIKKYDEAILLYNDIYQKETNDPQKPLGILGLANTYLEKGDTLQAIPIYKDLLLLEKSAFYSRYQKKIANPSTPKFIKKHIYRQARRFNKRIDYFQIKVAQNEACVNLGKIYLKKDDFRKALNYFRLSETVYPYQHFCGNAFAANDIFLAGQYSKCYLGLNNIDSAIVCLLPYIFENGLADNNIIIYLFDKTLRTKYSQEEINQILLDAENSIFIEKDKEQNEKDNSIVFYNAYVRLFNKTIEVPAPIELLNSYYLNYYKNNNNAYSEEEIKLKYIKIFKESFIYSKLKR